MKTGIAVVVVSYNTRESVRTCINSYLPQLDPAVDELIVVDNGSADGTIEMLSKDFPGVRLWISPSNAGFSFACNAGYRATRAPLVLFSNGDIRVPEGFLESARRKMEALPEVGILSPALLGEDGDVIQMSWGWDLSFLGEFRARFLSPRNVTRFPFVRAVVRYLQRKERAVPIVAGACMLIRREMLDVLHGMDEAFELYFEDADLCARCWDAGYQVRFSPEIRVFHGLGQSGKSIRNKIELVYRQSQIYFYRKHNSIFELVLLKLYLAFKFYVLRRCWRDPSFHRWFTTILFERGRLRLVDPL